MKRIKSCLAELAQNLKLMEPAERFRTLIDLGANLPPLASGEKSEKNRIPRCAANSYLAGSLDPDKTIAFRGESDSAITRGYLALLITAVTGARPRDLGKEFIKAVTQFNNTTHLARTVTPLKANSFSEIVYRIVEIAGNLTS